MSSLLLGSIHRSGFTEACSWWMSMCSGMADSTWSPALRRGSHALAYSMLARMVAPFRMRFPCSSKSSLTSLQKAQQGCVEHMLLTLHLVAHAEDQAPF